MPKRYKVTVSPRASRQLVAHVEFLSRKSVNGAVKLSAEFKTVVRTLKANPFQFPIDPNSDLPQAPRVALFTGRYQLYFDIDGDTVLIGAVRDCRQDPNDRTEGGKTLR